MKQAYVKPAFIVERFSLTQNIANGCGALTNGSMGTPNSVDKTSCGWAIGSTTVLFVNNAICTEPAGENDDVFGICYNAPNSSNAIFGA